MIRKDIFFRNLKQPTDVLLLKPAGPLTPSRPVGLRKLESREHRLDSLPPITDKITFSLDTQFRFSYIHPTETRCSYFDLV